MPKVKLTRISHPRAAMVLPARQGERSHHG